MRKLGERNGWTYTANPRGGKRWNVAKEKGKQRKFLGVAHTLEQAQRMADADKSLLADKLKFL